MRLFTSYSMLLLCSCNILYSAGETGSPSGDGIEPGTAEVLPPTGPSGISQYLGGKFVCNDFADEGQFLEESESVGDEIGETNTKEFVENELWWLNHIRYDSTSDGFYVPYNMNGVREEVDHTEKLASTRRPFFGEPMYTVVEEPINGYGRYLQVSCGCLGTDCDNLHFVDPFIVKWDLRIMQLCLVRKRAFSRALRIRKKRRAACSHSDHCYGYLGKLTTDPWCFAKGRKVIKYGLTTTEKYGLLFYHNLVRALRAEGSNVGTLMPYNRTVANMMEMEWDPVLADQAQRLANTCDFKHDCSFCRRSGYNAPVGQFFLEFTMNSTDYLSELPMTLLNVGQLTPDVVQSFHGENSTGVHGQMFWAETSRVGCGLIQSQVNDKVETLLACNYYPAGNLVGSPVFLEGDTCSRCPAGTRCTRFSKVLCSRFFHEGTEYPPPEESKQFFALTKEERAIRTRILDMVLSATPRGGVEP